MTVIEQAVSRLRREFREAGREKEFDALKVVLTGDRPAVSYAKLAERLSTTEAAVKMTVLRMRRRFGEVLREEVAHTVADPAEIDDELRHLLAVLVLVL